MSIDFIKETKSFLVSHKRKLGILLVLVILLTSVSVGVKAMYRVTGVVTGIEGSNVTVANFFRTQTVDLGNIPVNKANIKPGDNIKIQKNWQGVVISIKVGEQHRGQEEHKGKQHRG